MRFGWLAFAVMLCAPSTGMAQEGREGAAAFVRSVYASYVDDDVTRPLMDRGLELVWSDRMAALIRRDQELADGDLPYLDADPICNCQDWGTISVKATTVAYQQHRGRTRVVVTVRFSNLGQEQVLQLLLSGNPFGWKIDDVLNAGYPTLGEQIAASNARIEAGGRALGRD